MAGARRETANLDAHRYRPEAAVAFIVGRIAGQCVLSAQFVRDEGVCGQTLTASQTENLLRFDVAG